MPISYWKCLPWDIRNSICLIAYSFKSAGSRSNIGKISPRLGLDQLEKNPNSIFSDKTAQLEKTI